jgi:thiol-disulfide isomerase/thioredoxin
VKREALASIAAALAPVALAGCHAAASPRPASSVLPEWGPPQPGDPAPELVLPSLHGSTVKLSSSRGHWVLLHFTASWCPFCDAEITHLDEIAAARAKDGLVVLVVDVREPLERWAAYAKDKVSPAVEPLYDLTGDAVLPFVPPRARPEFHERADVIFDSTLLVDPKGVVRMFLMPDSAHFDPTFPDVRAELGRIYDGAASVPPPVRVARVDGMLDASRVVSITVPPATALPGAHGEIAVTMRIAPGYHTMPDKPSKPEYIPTRIRFDDAPAMTFGSPAWPAASSFDLGGETIATFEREVVARVPFDVAAGVGRGPQTVHGTLHFQACTPASCLAPATTAFEATVVVQ